MSTFLREGEQAGAGEVVSKSHAEELPRRAMSACRRALQGLRLGQAIFSSRRSSTGAVMRGLAANGEIYEDRFEQEPRFPRGSSCWWRVESKWSLHTATTGRREGEGEGEVEVEEEREELKRRSNESSSNKGESEVERWKVGNEEARELVQQVHLASLRKRLREDGRDCIRYEELLQFCRNAGLANNDEEAAQLARVFHQAGVVLTFRDKVHLHPEKIAERVANVLPLTLLGEDDQRRLELMALAQKKEEIDLKAHKQMRVVLWSGLVALTLQVLVFFRLTFWELSWDIMEPIAFFATAGGLICSYTYFLITSRDPSYQDFMQRLYHSRQRKLFRKQNFDIKRFKELQMQCQTKPPTKQLLEDCD